MSPTARWWRQPRPPPPPGDRSGLSSSRSGPDPPRVPRHPGRSIGGRSTASPPPVVEVGGTAGADGSVGPRRLDEPRRGQDLAPEVRRLEVGVPRRLVGAAQVAEGERHLDERGGEVGTLEAAIAAPRPRPPGCRHGRRRGTGPRPSSSIPTGHHRPLARRPPGVGPRVGTYGEERRSTPPGCADHGSGRRTRDLLEPGEPLHDSCPTGDGPSGGGRHRLLRLHHRAGQCPASGRGAPDSLSTSRTTSPSSRRAKSATSTASTTEGRSSSLVTSGSDGHFGRVPDVPTRRAWTPCRPSGGLAPVAPASSVSLAMRGR